MGFLPEAERNEPIEAYYRRLTNPDPAVHLPAAEAWNHYEASCSVLKVNFNDSKPTGSGAAGLALARIEAHYFKNNMFLDGDTLLNNLGAVRDIPAIIIQGRYDMVCPIVTADKLAAAWPKAEYVIVPDAGHSAMEPGIRSALVKATEELKYRLIR